MVIFQMFFCGLMLVGREVGAGQKKQKRYCWQRRTILGVDQKGNGKCRPEGTQQFVRMINYLIYVLDFGQTREDGWWLEERELLAKTGMVDVGQREGGC